MIRGLSPIPRGGGIPDGKEGVCIPTPGALRPIEGVWVRPHSFGAFLHPETQLPPPAGSPKNHSPRRGPTILGGTFGARVRATSLPRKIPRQIMPLAAMRPARRANSGRAAAYFVSSARHSPGRRLLRLRSERVFVVSKNAPNKREESIGARVRASACPDTRGCVYLLIYTISCVRGRLNTIIKPARKIRKNFA